MPLPAAAPERQRPSPADIISLAESMGYTQRRSEVSSTLFFVRTGTHRPGGSDGDGGTVKINVFHTTRSVMTQLTHPTRGTNELWRSAAYGDIDDLRSFFADPRRHTGRGYRLADGAVRGCVSCGLVKGRGEFSKNQWTKMGPDANRCRDCVAGGVRSAVDDDADVDDLTRGLGNATLTDDDGGDEDEDEDFPALTLDALRTHDKSGRNDKGGRNGGGGGGAFAQRGRMERRQFNCPDCPRYGRGRHVFFKKVPSMKPVLKCPRCKEATGGRCRRLYPIPKHSEKGYGLYKCRTCGDQWGSSRAIASVGQACYSCERRGIEIYVKPFRLEVPKNTGRRGRGQRTRRVPREPIGETEVDDRGYGESDRRRNLRGGAPPPPRGGFGGGASSSYDVEPLDDDFDSRPPASPSIGDGGRVPSGYRHKCAACASGACRNRRIPKSGVHDSDGDTVSTRASVVTDSSVDKGDFVDRDEDFSGFAFEDDDDDDDDGDWVAV